MIISETDLGKLALIRFTKDNQPVLPSDDSPVEIRAAWGHVYSYDQHIEIALQAVAVVNFGEAPTPFTYERIRATTLRIIVTSQAIASITFINERSFSKVIPL